MITQGAWDVAYFNDWALCANSLRSFWGGRYNTLVHHLLKYNVAVPMRERGWSRASCVLGAFGVSGLLHMFVAHATFGHHVWTGGLFFVAHGAALLAEEHLRLFKVSPVLSTTWLWATLIVTAPLYPMMFVDEMPRYLADRPPSSVPVLNSFVEACTFL